MGLIEVYDRIRQDERLVGIKQFFGYPAKDQLATVPKIVWVPSQDTYEGAEREVELFVPRAVPCTIGGRDSNGGVEYAPAQGAEGVTIVHGFEGAGLGLLVLVEGPAVSVRLEVDAAGNVLSTAAQIVAAIQAHPAASALLLCQATGTGAGVARSSRRTKIRATKTRVAGCELHIWANDHAEMERLLNRLHGALWWNTRGSLRVGGGQHADREDNSTAAIGYIQDIAVEVPIYDELPAAEVQRFSATSGPTR